MVGARWIVGLDVDGALRWRGVFRWSAQAVIRPLLITVPCGSPTGFPRADHGLLADKPKKGFCTLLLAMPIRRTLAAELSTSIPGF